MVAVHLISREHPEVGAWFGTYHMPCAFTQPKLMAIHAALALQHLQRLAAATGTTAEALPGSDGTPCSIPCSTPCLLGGDLNLKPSDPLYRLLTSGRMDPALTQFYPKPPAGDAWVPDLACGMASAYAAAHGCEPDFTNFAKCLKDDSPFIDCLDYVLTSPHFCVLGAPALPHRDAVSGPFPTESEPSDHLLLSVEVALPLLPDAALAGLYGACAAAEGGGGGGKRRRVEWGGGGARSREGANEALRAAKQEELRAFIARPDRTLDFPPSMNSFERRLVHEIAEGLDLLSQSHGEGYDRFIRVEKKS